MVFFGFLSINISICSRNGLVLNDNKPFLEPMMSYTCDANMRLSASMGQYSENSIKYL